jgi:ATP-dependent Lon protease
LDAAKSVGIRVILPEKNKEQYEELEGFIKEGIDVEFASNYDQIFPLIFPDFKPKRGKKNGFFKCCSIQ